MGHVSRSFERILASLHGLYGSDFVGFARTGNDFASPDLEVQRPFPKRKWHPPIPRGCSVVPGHPVRLLFSFLAF